MKIVINTCYGGFGLSDKAKAEYRRRCKKNDDMYDWDLDRDDPILVSVVEDLGEEANGRVARLVIEDIPDDYEGYWRIDEYDGAEHVVIDGKADAHMATAAILYDPDLPDHEKIARLMVLFPPPPSMLKKAKVDVLYDKDGPVVKRLADSWAERGGEK